MANSPSGEAMVDRLVKILETFDSTRTEQTVAQIARRSGLPSSSAYRIVEDLEGAGLLDRAPSGRVRLGLRLWELAQRGSTALGLRQLARPYMEEVQRQVREHTQLTVVEHGDVLCIERISDPAAGANITRIAGRLPIHASSSGLVLLAFGPPELVASVLAGPLPRVGPETPTTPDRLRRVLAEVRRVGYAYAPGTIADESAGVAVPVRDPRGATVAALSVVLRRDAEGAPAVAEILRRAAHGLEGALRANAAAAQHGDPRAARAAHGEY